MRRILLSGIALIAMVVAMPVLAADIPVKGPVYKAAAAPAPVSWSGCYVGVHGGYGWADWKDKDLPNAEALAGNPIADEGDPIVFNYSGNYSDNGWVGGAQVGCDHQYNRLVVGLVMDVSWGSLSDNSGPFGISPVPPLQDSDDEFAKVKLKNFGTARVRAGVTHGNGLYYLTGGLAWARNKLTVSGEVASGGVVVGSFSVSDTVNHFGYAYGLGAEWLLPNGWSFGLE